MCSSAEGFMAEIIMLQTRECTNESPTFPGQSALLFFRKFQQQYPWNKKRALDQPISHISRNN